MTVPLLCPFLQAELGADFGKAVLCSGPVWM